MSETQKIEAGLELDRAVAIALGCRPVKDEIVGVGGYYCTCEMSPHDSPGWGLLRGYSTDLNAAFAAAEEVGLWGKHALGRQGDEWDVFRDINVHEIGYGDSLASAPTPALAICAAILKLKE